MVSARRFSVRQLIAVTTAVAAALVLAGIVASPPLGSMGLAEARLPALVLVVSLWFCGGRFDSRMAIYAVAGALFAIPFCTLWLAETDLIFGHQHGPPQWAVVATVGGAVSVVAGVLWLAAQFWRRSAPAAVETRRRRSGSPRRFIIECLGMGALAAASGLALLIGGSELANFSSFKMKSDHYVEKRLLHQKMSVLRWAEQLSRRDLPRRGEMSSMMASHYLMPDDAAAIAVLARLLDDPDVEIRRNVARTLARLVDDAWRSGRLTADFPDAETRAALVGGLSDDAPVVREELSRAVLHIDPAAVVGPRALPGSPPVQRSGVP
jgi:hypothetical protein